MEKKLIAFYSRAGQNYFGGSYISVEVGNTEKVADMMAEILNADEFKIEQKVPYSDDYRTCVDESRRDLAENKRPELISLPENFEKYDEIYLGYPIYCGTMPMAVYTFLEALDFSGKTIYPFCTHEGSGLTGTERDIKNTVPAAVVKKGLAVHGSSVDSSRNLVKKWVK